MSPASTAAPPSRVLAALVSAGLVRAEQACGQEVSVLDASRSNPVHVVVVDGVPRYVVKQAGPAVETGSPVVAETAAYRWLADEPSLAAVAPRALSVAWADAQGWLVLEAVSDARPLNELILRLDGDFVGFAVDLARMLGHLHACGAGGRAAETLPVRRPWLLDLPTTCPEFVLGRPAARAVVAGLHRRAGLMAVVREVAASWRSCTAIHGDVKWDNVLARLEPDGRWRLWLIDWELAGLGDPGWDLAGLLEGIVTSSIGSGAALDAGAAAPAMRSVVDAYEAVAGPDLVPKPTQLVQFMAARIVQAVVQIAAMDGDAATLAAARQQLLELAASMSDEPTAWASTLLGETRPYN